MSYLFLTFCLNVSCVPKVELIKSEWDCTEKTITYNKNPNHKDTAQVCIFVGNK